MRLGESLGELIGSGGKIDDQTFVEDGVTEEFAPELIKRAETIIGKVGEEYKTVYLAEYERLMRARLGLVSEKESDSQELFSELLDTLEKLELDFNHFFRRLSSIKVFELASEEERKQKASIFFHAEGMTATSVVSESAAREKVAAWLGKWAERVGEDWGEKDEEREKEMKKVNPKFIPRSWVLDEIIKKVEREGQRDIIKRVMAMAEHPFEEEWGGDREEEERWCGDVPRQERMMQCSCSS